jgi:SAM-dependent methyltransferase
METWEEAVLWLRSQPDQQALVRAAYFDDPLLEAARRYYGSSEWAAVRALLPSPPGEALDLGAGRGIVSGALAWDGWSVTALEPDPSDIVGSGAIRSLVRDADLPIQILSDWGESLPFPDGSFDMVICRQVLHHAKDLQALCGEVHRVLRPGGRMFALREHVISRPSDIKAFFRLHPLHHRYGGEHAYTLKEYLRAIRRAGFEIDEVMNPFGSEINTSPETIPDLQKRIAARLRVPSWVISRSALLMIGSLINTPGRLYSFVARKKPDA